MKIILKIKWAVLGIFSPMISMAAITLPNAPSGAVTTSLTTVISNVLNTAMGVVGLIAIVVIVYGGIKLTMSGGEEEQSKAGKNYITYGIIGLVVVILAYSIVKFIVGAVV